MIKKTVALATLACFLVFSCSCIYSWKKTPLVSVKPEKRTEVKISAVQDHSGKKTEFSKDPAAKIQGDSVVGTRVIKNFRLEKSKIREQVTYAVCVREDDTVVLVKYNAILPKS